MASKGVAAKSERKSMAAKVTKIKPAAKIKWQARDAAKRNISGIMAHQKRRRRRK
jgi:hypothetical protein